MKLSSIRISNFKCFGPEPVQVDLENFTTLIGANGAGKSAILQALIRLFGQRKSDRALTRADFHIPTGIDPESLDEIELWIEVKLEFPALAANANDPTVPECFRHMIVEAPGTVPFCRVRLSGKWRRTAQLEGEVDEELWWLVSADVDPADDAKQRMLNYDRSRIQVIYVPASRDPSAHLRQAAGSLLNPILKAITWSEATKTSATDAADQVRDAVASEPGMQRLQEAVTQEWRKLQEFAPLRDVKFQPLDPDFESLLSHVSAAFHGGTETETQPIERLSDGLRSLFYFSLLGARFDLERLVTPDGTQRPFDFSSVELPSLTLFAIEEPENHLSPQYLSRILALLQRLSGHEGAQVLLTSHSPGILSRVEPETVRHLRLDSVSGRATIKPIVLPAADAGEVYKYVKEAVRAYPELYFASAIILGEGDSECIVLPRLAKANGHVLDQRFIAVVPLGGRHVNHFWRLLNGLDIPYVTLLDLDRERFGGGWGRVHYAVTELLKFPLVLTLESMKVSQQVIDALLTRSIDDDKIEKWISFLEKYGVFFSSPLDLDFSMLEAFPQAYRGATTGTGPRMPTDAAQHAARLEQARSAVLKPEGGDGHTYTVEQKANFIWYQYLFLGRGKPSTHILALNALSDVQLELLMPEVFSRLFSYILPPPPPTPPPVEPTTPG